MHLYKLKWLTHTLFTEGERCILFYLFIFFFHIYIAHNFRLTVSNQILFSVTLPKLFQLIAQIKLIKKISSTEPG